MTISKLSSTNNTGSRQQDVDNDAKPRRGRPVNEALVPEILNVAGELFLEHGYQGTTMEAVARGVGMSKLTLYKRFPTKEDLFAAVITAKCKQFIPDAIFETIGELSVREGLLLVARSLIRLLISREATAIETLLRSEGDNHQGLRELFFNAGPERVKAAIGQHFASLAAQGKLNVTDPVLAAHFFAALFKGSDIHMRCGLRVGPTPDAKVLDLYAEQAVDFFLRAYGPKG